MLIKHLPMTDATVIFLFFTLLPYNIILIAVGYYNVL